MIVNETMRIVNELLHMKKYHEVEVKVDVGEPDIDCLICRGQGTFISNDMTHTCPCCYYLIEDA